MDIDRFWDLIERARAKAGPAADQAIRDYDDPDISDNSDDYWSFDGFDIEAALTAAGLATDTAERSANIDQGPTSIDQDLADTDQGRADAVLGQTGQLSRGEEGSDAGGPTRPGAGVSGRLDDGEFGPEPNEFDDDAEDEFDFANDNDDDEDDIELDIDEFDEVTDPIASALADILGELPVEEIASFENIFDTLDAQADRDDIANAATLIQHGFLSDDTFMDFRAGLIALGRTTFERTLENPDSLADHPMVREIAQANDPRWLGREDMLYAACQAYSTATGESESAFYDFAERVGTFTRPEESDDAASTPDEEDEDDEWSVIDEALTRTRLPRLSELFYDRSMRNRARAMQSLGLSG